MSKFLWILHNVPLLTGTPISRKSTPNSSQADRKSKIRKVKLCVDRRKGYVYCSKEKWHIS